MLSGCKLDPKRPAARARAAAPAAIWPGAREGVARRLAAATHALMVEDGNRRVRQCTAAGADMPLCLLQMRLR